MVFKAKTLAISTSLLLSMLLAAAPASADEYTTTTSSYDTDQDTDTTAQTNLQSSQVTLQTSKTEEVPIVQKYGVKYENKLHQRKTMVRTHNAVNQLAAQQPFNNQKATAAVPVNQPELAKPVNIKNDFTYINNTTIHAAPMTLDNLLNTHTTNPLANSHIHTSKPIDRIHPFYQLA